VLPWSVRFGSLVSRYGDGRCQEFWNRPVSAKRTVWCFKLSGRALAAVFAGALAQRSLTMIAQFELSFE